MAKVLNVEVVVVGGGPAGLTAAIALAGAGIETALIARKPPADHRTSALLAGSVAALETLGVWDACAGQAAPLRTLRIVDATSRLIRAPEVRFTADEIGLDAFGQNIENRHLVAALDSRAAAVESLIRIEGEAVTVESRDSDVVVSTKDGATVMARLVIGADGRRSLCRAAAGIESVSRTYPQTALTFNLAHTRPHRDTSTEFHTEQGPFTLVPLTAETRHMISDDVLAAMKPSSYLINIARGDVIDEAALVRRLQAGEVAGAGLDVFAEEPPEPDNPLWSMPNVIMTPRIGGMSDRYAEQVLPLMVHNLRAFVDGRVKDMRNVV